MSYEILKSAMDFMWISHEIHQSNRILHNFIKSNRILLKPTGFHENQQRFEHNFIKSNTILLIATEFYRISLKFIRDFKGYFIEDFTMDVIYGFYCKFHYRFHCSFIIDFIANFILNPPDFTIDFVEISLHLPGFHLNQKDVMKSTGFYLNQQNFITDLTLQFHSSGKSTRFH